MVLLAAGVIALQDKAPVDRSAEPALRQVFATVGNVHNAHLILSYFSKASWDGYVYSRTNDLYVGPSGQMRLESNSATGDMSLTVSDGMTLMNDPLSDDDTITLKKATSFHEIAPQECIAYLLEGTANFEKVVEKDQPIIFAEASAGHKAIEVRMKTLGKVVITYSESDGFPRRIDLFRSQRRRDDGVEQTTPSTKEYVNFVSSGSLPRSLFSATPPKGKKFEDQRNTKETVTP